MTTTPDRFPDRVPTESRRRVRGTESRVPFPTGDSDSRDWVPTGSRITGMTTFATACRELWAGLCDHGRERAACPFEEVEA